MERMNTTTFKKEVLKKGKWEEYQLAPYFTLESWSTKMIVLSNKIMDVTAVTYRNKTIALAFPMKKTVKESLEPYFEELQNHVHVACPIVTIYDMKGNQVVQLQKKERESIA